MSTHVDCSKQNPAKDAPVGDKPFEFGFGFEIDNIKTLKYDEPVYSPPCNAHDLAWKIMIRKSKEKESLGFFLQCEPASKKVEGYWTCYATATLIIVNKKNSSKNLSREIKRLFNEKEIDWGYTSFQSLNELYKSNLVISNSIKFHVTVFANTPTFADTNNENSEDEESSEDEVDESEDQIEMAINQLKSEMRLWTTNLQTEMNLFKADLHNEFDEINKILDFSPTNLQKKLSSFKTDLREEVDKMIPLLVTSVKTEIRSYMTAAQEDLAEMLKRSCLDVIAYINSKTEGGNVILLGGEKKKSTKKIENSDSTDVRNENVAAQVGAVVEEKLQKILEETMERNVDTVVREISKIMKRKKESKVDAVIKKIPEECLKKYQAKIGAVVKEMLEAIDKENEIVSTDENKRVAEVITEEPENSIDGFEIISGVENKCVEDKNSDASLPFEMISKDIDNDSRAFCKSDETAKSDLAIYMIEGHFANKSSERLVTTDCLTDPIDTIENRFLERLEAPVEDVLKNCNQSITTNQEIKSHENEIKNFVKYIMRRNPTYSTEDMVRNHLKSIAIRERKEEKSSANKADVINYCHRK